MLALQWVRIGRALWWLELQRFWARGSVFGHLSKGKIRSLVASVSALHSSSMQSWLAYYQSLLQPCRRVKARPVRQYATNVTVALSRCLQMHPIHLLVARLVRLKLRSLYDHLSCNALVNVVDVFISVCCLIFSHFLLLPCSRLLIFILFCLFGDPMASSNFNFVVSISRRGLQ